MCVLLPLWDTGATISLIANKRAKELHLNKIAKRSLSVVKVGGGGGGGGGYRRDIVISVCVTFSG